MRPRTRGVLETLLRKLAPAVCLKMERPAGVDSAALRLCKQALRAGSRLPLSRHGAAPASPDWHTGILLLNDGRMTAQPVRAALWKIMERGRHGSPFARAPVCTKRTNTAAAPFGAAPAGFLGGCFGVLEAHLPESLLGYVEKIDP